MAWRIAKQRVGPQFFLVGDAACTLDPSAGHGVLCVLMTGMMASYLISKINKNYLLPHQAYDYYHLWVTQWFEHDACESRTRMIMMDYQ